MKASKFFAVLLATVMLLSTAVAVSAVEKELPGDVNNDGSISMPDYLLVRNYILGKVEFDEDELRRANVDGQNGITIQDYMLIRLHILQKIDLTENDEEDAAITAIKNAVNANNGKLSKSAQVTYDKYTADATISFEVIDGVLTLHGNAVNTEQGLTVDLYMPIPKVSETYEIKGEASFMNLSGTAKGSIKAAEYSKKQVEIADLTIESNVQGNDMVTTMAKPYIKQAMDEFLRQANALLVEKEVGVTIADLGFTTYYNEING